MKRVIWSIIGLVSLICTPAIAQSNTSSFYAAGGGEAWFSPVGGGHGYFILSYQKPKVFQNVFFDATLNTDTIQLTLDNYTLNDNLSVGGYLKGQAVLAGLLQDYYQGGTNDMTRGFNASYLQSAMYLKRSDAPHYLQLEIGGRRWFFSEAAKTNDALVLPEEYWVLEPRLRYTYWDVKYDEATNQPHRHYWRIDGLAFGMELGMDIRNTRQPFGAIDPDVFSPVDLRNPGSRTSVLARGWVHAGKTLTDRVRVQGMISAATGQNQDDLNRVRVGGLNPYVIPVAGLPWASYLPDTVVGSSLSAHLKVLSNSEVGVMMQAAVMDENDIFRTTIIEDPNIGGLMGLGLFGDWRVGTWQFDTRAGWALPFDALNDNPHLTLWLSVGKQIW